MRLWMALILLIVVGLVLATGISAQDQRDATERLESLHAQLVDAQYKETELKIQLEQLQLDMKPENIERHFSGFGSTRPEELRDLRRRQLQLRKDQVTAELEHLASSRSRLEAAISNAEIHRQTAMAMGALQRDRNRSFQLLTFSRVLVVALVLAVVLGSLLLHLVIRDRRKGRVGRP